MKVLLSLYASWLLPSSSAFSLTVPSSYSRASTIHHTSPSARIIRHINLHGSTTLSRRHTSVQLLSTVHDLEIDGVGIDITDDTKSLESWTVSEIKEKLREQGLKVSGTKSELIDRLTAHQQRNDTTVTSNKHSADDESSNTYGDNALNDETVSQLPELVLESFIKYASTPDGSQPKLLPIQQKSYQHVANGGDAVLFSPTGTGKTLAYVLPLAARLLGWKRDGTLQHKKQLQKQRFARQNRNDSINDKQIDPAAPTILVIEPSRELARQVGKVWTHFHPTATKSSKYHVVTVYGGVPMTRHASLLSSKTDVVIGTPGRIRELIREKYLSTSQIRSIVLDEADTLLNFKDVPEVEWLLEGMQNDYQLVLASATINNRVEKFVDEVMEIEVGEEGYVIVEPDELNDEADISMDGVQINGVDSGNNEEQIQYSVSKTTPVVRHWSMAASASSRVQLASDLVVTTSPRRGIIFVPSKAEAEMVAQELSERLSTANDVTIHVLHGDMVQQARSRTVLAFRGDILETPTKSMGKADDEGNRSKMTRILVATDVAARGLDMPAVDLVLQFGVPRKTGKDGTFDSELYIHRTGRAGRFGNTRTADAIVLYDRTQGEWATLGKLQEEIKSLKGVDILPRTLPSPKEVMNASYERAFWRCEEFGRKADENDGNSGTQALVHFFKERLLADLGSDVDNVADEQLLQRLATAMAALSGLEEAVHPRSLLSADPRDRTVRVWTDSCDANNPLSPPEVTNVVKKLGSGKLGRISICEDGSAIFDLAAKKAEKLLSASDHLPHWHFEIPSSLPSMPV